MMLRAANPRPIFSCRRARHSPAARGLSCAGGSSAAGARGAVAAGMRVIIVPDQIEPPPDVANMAWRVCASCRSDRSEQTTMNFSDIVLYNSAAWDSPGGARQRVDSAGEQRDNRPRKTGRMVGGAHRPQTCFGVIGSPQPARQRHFVSCQRRRPSKGQRSPPLART